MSANVKVLDCTFRDGGYYNKWDFDSALVHKYLYATENAKIDVIELGFRNLPQNIFLGAFAYTTDIYINTLKINDEAVVGVMIDANSIMNSELSINDVIDLLFQSKEKSRVDLVRIAVHFNRVSECKKVVQALVELGYQVGLNLMQANNRSSNELSTVAKMVQGWNKIDVLYFADSLGSMDNDDVVRVSSALKMGWNGELGFHAHNNKGLAVSNSLIAIENGITWIDSTMLGMGRGAGNAQTEHLLLELVGNYQMNYKPSAVFGLVLSDFTPLHRQYRWGESLLYSLAAMHDIHPSYIQEMLSDNHYSNKEILQAIDFMSSIDSSHYNKNLLLTAHGSDNNKGSWNAKDWCCNKEVLILGSGDSLQVYQEGIAQYIEIYKPIVVSLNINHNFPEHLIDVYASSNESKMLGEFNLYSKLNKPLIISSALLDRVMGKSNNVRKLWDYGLSIKQGAFIMEEKGCTLPYELSAGYVLSLVNIGGAKSISIVGFDGYNRNDIRQIRMNELLDLYSKQPLIPITALTPTTYQVAQNSIYAVKIN